MPVLYITFKFLFSFWASYNKNLSLFNFFANCFAGCSMGIIFWSIFSLLFIYVSLLILYIIFILISFFLFGLVTTKYRLLFFIFCQWVLLNVAYMKNANLTRWHSFKDTILYYKLKFIKTYKLTSEIHQGARFIQIYNLS